MRHAQKTTWRYVTLRGILARERTTEPTSTRSHLVSAVFRPEIPDPGVNVVLKTKLVLKSISTKSRFCNITGNYHAFENVLVIIPKSTLVLYNFTMKTANISLFSKFRPWSATRDFARLITQHIWDLELVLYSNSTLAFKYYLKSSAVKKCLRNSNTPLELWLICNTIKTQLHKWNVRKNKSFYVIKNGLKPVFNILDNIFVQYKGQVFTGRVLIYR